MKHVLEKLANEVVILKLYCKFVKIPFQHLSVGCCAMQGSNSGGFRGGQGGSEFFQNKLNKIIVKI